MIKTYLCIQRNPQRASDEPASATSPAQMEEMYAKFNAWSEKFKDNTVDMRGLMDGRVVTKDTISDVPFIESDEVIGQLL